MATNNPSTKPDQREELVMEFVHQFFRKYPQETFQGDVTTDEVVAAVHSAFLVNGLRWSSKMEGHVYDAIFDIGPACEFDTQWFEKYGKGISS